MPSNHPPDSELLQDFLTTPPGWLLRSGMGVLFSMAVAGFAMTWFIRYPDQLEATATVRTSQAPVDIFAPVSYTHLGMDPFAHQQPYQHQLD